ncbi:unnamed protein product [Porites evermanni]|uniref:Uncharacterized protein n=1 Tax=Porites evermanni TaxID=104178 RepID=A0ABN8S485_9CNID|nr:unnamed protein product [Porites evermanni]
MPVVSSKIFCLSLAHIMLGAFMMLCGAVQVILQMKYLWLDSFYAGIWVGIWMIFTGIMGIIANSENRLYFSFVRRIGVAPTRKLLDAFAIATTFFCVISTLLGLAIIGCYVYTAAFFWKVNLSHLHYLVIVCFTCLFAIAETIIGACATIYIYEPEQANRIAPLDETGQVRDDVQAQDIQTPMVQQEAWTSGV